MTHRQRIGIFGGTFDPIHTAHLVMARAAMDSASLDTVLFVVAAIPPHKQHATHASPEDRLAMVEAALTGEANFEASGIELEREGPSYTADTLRVLHTLHPDADLFMIIGEDSLVDFPKWREPKAILELARLLVLPRPGINVPIHPSLEGQYDFVPFEASTLSSSEVRDALEKGELLEGMLPTKVQALIEERGLYGR